MIERIFSKINPNTELHIIVRRSDAAAIRQDVIQPDNDLQLAIMTLPKGKRFLAHRHIVKRGTGERTIAQESWVVIKGKVKAILYDWDNTIIAEPILNEGDCSITLCGGHNYEILEEGTIVYEFKTGPYDGQEKDKVFI